MVRVRCVTLHDVLCCREGVAGHTEGGCSSVHCFLGWRVLGVCFAKLSTSTTEGEASQAGDGCPVQLLPTWLCSVARNETDACSLGLCAALQHSCCNLQIHCSKLHGCYGVMAVFVLWQRLCARVCFAHSYVCAIQHNSGTERGGADAAVRCTLLRTGVVASGKSVQRLRGACVV